MLAKIRDDTKNVLNMQHIIPNSKRWDSSDIPTGGQISQWVAKLLFCIMSKKLIILLKLLPHLLPSRAQYVKGIAFFFFLLTLLL